MAPRFPSRGFAEISRHLDESQLSEAIRLSLAPHGSADSILSLSSAEIRSGLYEPSTSNSPAAVLWRQALESARTDHTPDGLRQLLFVWLALPQLTGTVYRVCTLLHADRDDVEAEMLLALLEGLHTADPEPHTPQTLIKAARNAAWRLARGHLREVPTEFLDNLPDSTSAASADETTEAVSTSQHIEVEVRRPASVDGLHAPLRFRVSPEHLRQGAFDRILMALSRHSTGHESGQRTGATTGRQNTGRR